MADRDEPPAYRSFGAADQYDLIGAAQFAPLSALEQELGRDILAVKHHGSYARAEVASVIASARLAGQPVGWFHPRHQWWLLSQPDREPLPAGFLAALTGATLAGGSEQSWNAFSSPAARPEPGR